MLSVIIPTYDSGRALDACLRSVQGALVSEIILADGGSRSSPLTELPRSWQNDKRVRLIKSRKGRGAQLAAGARAAKQNWLLFLHSDTHLSKDWEKNVRTFIAAHPPSQLAAAVFRLRLNSKSWRARATQRGANARTKIFGLPYGDQGLCLSRPSYERLGGYQDLPLMEDVALVRRLPRRALACLAAEAVSSAARYERGYLRRWSINLTCLGLFYLGVSPQRLAKLYG